MSKKRVRYVKVTASMVKNTGKAILFYLYDRTKKEKMDFWIPVESNFAYDKNGFIYCSERVFFNKFIQNARRQKRYDDPEKYCEDERYLYDQEQKKMVILKEEGYVRPKEPSIGKIDLTSENAEKRAVSPGWHYDAKTMTFTNANVLLATKDKAFTASKTAKMFGVSVEFVYWAFKTTESHSVNRRSNQAFDFFCSIKLKNFMTENPEKWMILVREFYGPDHKKTISENKKREREIAKKEKDKKIDEKGK